MKTLRDLIGKNSYKLVFNEIHSFYLKGKSTEQKLDSDINFYSAWNELSKLNKGKETENKLYLLQIEAEPDQPIIDVCMFDEKEDELFALDFVDWGDLIDMNIEKPNNMSEKICLAHILWEITFWGFSNKQVARERKKLRESIEDND